MVKTVDVGRMFGSDTGAGPRRLRPTSWRMNDIPIAVINGASRGAFRSGRYATRSIDAFRRPQNAMQQSSVTPRPQTIVTPELFSSSPIFWTPMYNVIQLP